MHIDMLILMTCLPNSGAIIAIHHSSLSEFGLSLRTLDFQKSNLRLKPLAAVGQNRKLIWVMFGVNFLALSQCRVSKVGSYTGLLRHSYSNWKASTPHLNASKTILGCSFHTKSWLAISSWTNLFFLSPLLIIT